MFHFIQQWLDQRRIRRSPITESQWQASFASLPLLFGLSKEETQRLRDMTILFMHHKAFSGAQGVVVNETMILTIALQACLPILNLGLDCYDGWHEVIVYPSGFVPLRKVTDGAGVEHFEQTHLSGESWQRGPVILAWDQAEQAGVIDGHNLVIHEFAHKLEMQNGEANGFPPLHSDMDRQAWTEAFSAGYKDFQQRCEHGRFKGFDCYAATSPAEFFAVFSELFFERPILLQQHYQVVYEQLQQYYRQDPLSRLAGI